MGRFKKGAVEAKAFMKSIRKKKANTEPDVTVTISAGTEDITGSQGATVDSIPPIIELVESLQDEELRLEKELVDGMPTKKEMTECPPGTIHKHLNWEKRNKEKIMRWKTIRRELYPANTNAANLENIRPKGE